MDAWQLKQRRSLPLDVKIELTKLKIRQWYDHWGGDVYVSFSGGKDSTVLLHLVREVFHDVPAVYCDTGLEYPEIREFVRQTENVTWLRPKMPFTQVIQHYGYPVVSKEQSQRIGEAKRMKAKGTRTKHWHTLFEGNKWGQGKISKKWQYLVDAPFPISHLCCKVMKKQPFHGFEKRTGLKSILGVMAAESDMRSTTYMQRGCNAFNLKRPVSTPIAFWTEADIWEYIRTRNVPYSPIYDMGYERTGCMFCLYGIHADSRPNRMERMKQTHPKQWNYCIYKLGLGNVLDYMGIEYGEEPPLLRGVE